MKELNLGLDSAVFLDDNPVERARIAEALPDVVVPDLPNDKMLYPSALRRLDCFETIPLDPVCGGVIGAQQFGIMTLISRDDDTGCLAAFLPYFAPAVFLLSPPWPHPDQLPMPLPFRVGG